MVLYQKFCDCDHSRDLDDHAFHDLYRDRGDHVPHVLFRDRDHGDERLLNNLMLSMGPPYKEFCIHQSTPALF